MRFLEIIDMYPELNVTIKAWELKEAIEHCVKMTCKELEQKETDTDTETYSSPDQVAKILNVSKSTLWRWAKQNYLVPIEVGGKRRYRMSDIKKILEGKKPIK
ncbi:Helix-turn-helix domain protein [anaerobic digester metagenome]|jgi:excisionase family DNA binding protein|uniref:helix-turn-helix domain-containing protein n=1 Tax=Lascolabacillus sp. TaxID=1924068 RepID=UPI00258A5D5B|nr:helix-turn-helix domain-containing protein [Lascolabacillus sp.]MDD2251168.1 helix-turn-helix domain-containing protein [Candidatus Cloacimonadota bacterium]MDD4759130.1 helix-turn-helix domain-containing protein [Lascolabacillus sp.]